MSVLRDNTTQTTISELTPSNIYSIEVAAVNGVGAGVYSDPPVIVQTPLSKCLQYYLHVHCILVCRLFSCVP